MAKKQDNPIKAAREKAGMTQQQAAELAGWTQARWAEFENGRFDPRLSTLRKAAQALGCKLEDIIKETKK